MNPAVARRLAALSSCALAALWLSACGGSGEGNPQASTPPPAQAETPIVLQGVALGAAGAQVCLDENRNQRCDAGEPSAVGDAQGAFTLASVLPSRMSGRAVMAAIPASGANLAYALEAPAAKSARLSPLTTLVQAGVAKGQSLADAEQAAATQLQVGVDDLYRDYTDTALAGRFYLAEAAAVVASHLSAGQPLVIAPAQDTASDYQVSRFNFSSARTYSVSYAWSPPSANGRDPARTFPMVVGLKANVPTYALLDTPRLLWRWSAGSGWALQAPGALEGTRSFGSPATTRTNTAFRNLGVVSDADVSGLALSDVVQQLRNTAKAGFQFTDLSPAAVSGTMPAGGRLRWARNHGVDTGGPAYDDSIRPAYRAASLAALAAAYPVTDAPTEANTASIGLVHGFNGCSPTAVGAGVACLKESVRAAFGPGTAVTYYLCDLAKPSEAVSNCTVAGTGSYVLGATDDQLTPLMRFTGAPALANVAAGTSFILLEREGRVSPGLILGPSVSVSQAVTLNRIAFEAIATALGVPAPAVPVEPSAHRGLWRLSYAGSASADCPRTVVDAAGRLSGQCTQPDGSLVTLDGTVSAGGTAVFNGLESTASFGGSFSGAASGTWQAGAAGGTWTAVKR